MSTAPSRAQQAASERRGDAATTAAWLIVSSAVQRLHESWEAVASMEETTQPSDAWRVAAELLEEASSLLWTEFPVRLAAAADNPPADSTYGEEGADVVPIRPHVLTPNEEAMAANATMEDVVLVAGDLTNEDRCIVVRKALAALGVAQVPDVPEDSIPAFMRMLLRGREWDVQ